MSKTVVFALGIDCAVGLEEKFEKWYDEIHIPGVLKSKALAGVTRYRLIPAGPVDEKTDAKYMAILEFKDREAFEEWFASSALANAMTEKGETWVTDDFEIKWKGVYEPKGTWQNI